MALAAPSRRRTFEDKNVSQRQGLDSWNRPQRPPDRRPQLDEQFGRCPHPLRPVQVYVSTDIISFFHQVLLDKSDVDTFCFFFFTDETMKEFTIRRFLSHVFGSGASSCVSSFTTRHLADRVHSLCPENVYDTICRRLYVDDAHGGGDSINEVVEL